MRRPRERSESGVYHVVLRGINRQDIFYDDDDYQHFLETIDQMKSDDQFAVYGYCLMTNHIHLLVRENTDTRPTGGRSFCWLFYIAFDIMVKNNWSIGEDEASKTAKRKWRLPRYFKRNQPAGYFL
jgi:REP element-mobilizing transposase RayT